MNLIGVKSFNQSNILKLKIKKKLKKIRDQDNGENNNTGDPSGGGRSRIKNQLSKFLILIR